MFGGIQRGLFSCRLKSTFRICACSRGLNKMFHPDSSTTLASARPEKVQRNGFTLLKNLVFFTHAYLKMKKIEEEPRRFNYQCNYHLFRIKTLQFYENAVGRWLVLLGRASFNLLHDVCAAILKSKGTYLVCHIAN